MSLDRSLKNRAALLRHRNVLTRAERLEVLIDQERWEKDRDSVFALPKVAHRKTSAGKKDKKAKADEAAAETTAETPGAAAAPAGESAK